MQRYIYNPTVYCPYCNADYVDKHEKRPIPCPYCHGDASIAKGFTDELKQILDEQDKAKMEEKIQILAPGYWRMVFRMALEQAP